MTSRKTALLMGAGASRDAGLPLTVELAEMIVQRANDPLPTYSRGRDAWVTALNFAYGAMMGHQSEDGGNPLEAVNIERLISAIRLLQDVESHEAAPFVLSWKGGVHNLPSSLAQSGFGHDGERLVKAISEAARGRAFAGRDVEKAVAAIVSKASTPTLGAGQTFKRAEETILVELARILSDLGSVDYLKPIADLALQQDGGVDVLTLNYDLSVEQMALHVPEVSIRHGIEDWQPGKALVFPEERGRINLLKMHGSLNWEKQESRRKMQPGAIRTTQIDSAENGGSPHRQMKPWIIVGDREKLATDGPTLYLFAAAQEMLSRTDHLVVVGYAFGDGHVNNLVRDWMAGDVHRTVTLVDPALKSGLGERDSFHACLADEYGATERTSFASRVGIIGDTASNGLKRALQYMHPGPIEPAAYFDVAQLPDEGEFRRLKVACNGPSVSGLRVTVSLRDPVDDRVSPVDAGSSKAELSRRLEEKGNSAGYSYSVAELGQLDKGSRATVYFRSSASGEAEVRIEAGRGDAPHGIHLIHRLALTSPPESE